MINKAKWTGHTVIFYKIHNIKSLYTIQCDIHLRGCSKPSPLSDFESKWCVGKAEGKCNRVILHNQIVR